MRRGLLLASVALIIFAVTSFVMVRVMPAPLKDSDYLVIGSVATLVALFVLFLALISTTMKASDVFFRRRKKKE